MATLGEQAVGNIVKLNVSGIETDFIVVHQGLPSSTYDSSCNGVWLLMNNIHQSMKWDDDGSPEYESSTVHSYLNDVFLTSLDAEIQGMVKSVKVPYTSNKTLVTGASGLQTKVFLLSHTEVGVSYSGANTEGANLTHFKGASNSKRIAYLDGTAKGWWTRTQRTTATNAAVYVNTSGSIAATSVANLHGVRPAMVLPSEVNVSSDGSIVTSSAAISGTVNIGGVERELTGEGYVNIGGVLRELSDSQANIDSIIKSLKG